MWKFISSTSRNISSVISLIIFPLLSLFLDLLLFRSLSSRLIYFTLFCFPISLTLLFFLGTFHNFIV